MTFSRSDTCKFIADQTAELSKLAAAKGLDTLSYLLSVAECEAEKEMTAPTKRKRAV